MTTQALNPIEKRRLTRLADRWAETALRELATGSSDIGDWQTDAEIPPSKTDTAWAYLMDRFADWHLIAAAVTRMRAER